MPAPRGKLPEVWPSGQRQQTVNLSGKALRWFESIRLHHLPGLGGARGSNSGVESQPSKLLVAGSNPVSRSMPARSAGHGAGDGIRRSARVSCAARTKKRVSASESRLPCAPPVMRSPASGRRRLSCAAYGGNVRCQALGAPALWPAAAEGGGKKRADRRPAQLSYSGILGAPAFWPAAAEGGQEARRPSAGTIPATPPPPPPSPPPRSTATGTPAP